MEDKEKGSYRHHVCSFEVNYQDIFDSSQKVLREYTNVLYSNFKTHSVCPLAFKTYKFKFGQINKMNATPDFYCYAICLHKGCRAFKFEIANINAIPMTCDVFQSKTELVHSPNAIKRRQIRGQERRKLGQIVIEKGATNTHLHMWDNANIEHLNFGNLSDAPNVATLATIRSEIVIADRLVHSPNAIKRRQIRGHERRKLAHIIKKNHDIKKCNNLNDDVTPTNRNVCTATSVQENSMIENDLKDFKQNQIYDIRKQTVTTCTTSQQQEDISIKEEVIYEDEFLEENQSSDSHQFITSQFKNEQVQTLYNTSMVKDDMTSPDKSRNNGSYRHYVCSFEVNYQDIFDSSQKVLREYTNVLYSNFKTHSVCPLAFKTYKFKFGQINKMNATPDFYCYAICLHKGCRAFKFEIANINAIPMTCDVFQSKTELVHSPNAIKRRQIRGQERRKLGQIVIEKGATNTHLHMWDNANIEHLNFGNLSDAPNVATLATIRSEIVIADRLVHSPNAIKRRQIRGHERRKLAHIIKKNHDIKKCNNLNDDVTPTNRNVCTATSVLENSMIEIENDLKDFKQNQIYDIRKQTVTTCTTSQQQEDISIKEEVIYEDEFLEENQSSDSHQFITSQFKNEQVQTLYNTSMVKDDMTSPDKSRNNGSYRHHVCSFEVNYQDIFDSSQKVLREYTNVLYSNFKTHSVCPLAFKTYKFKFGQINKMNATPDFYCYAICLHKGCRAFKFEIANINAIPMTCDAFQSKTELVHSPNAIKRRQIRGQERRKLGQIVIEKGATNTHLHMWDNANIEHLNFGNLSDAPNVATLATIRSEIVIADRLVHSPNAIKRRQIRGHERRKLAHIIKKNHDIKKCNNLNDDVTPTNRNVCTATSVQENSMIEIENDLKDFKQNQIFDIRKQTVTTCTTSQQQEDISIKEEVIYEDEFLEENQSSDSHQFITSQFKNEQVQTLYNTSMVKDDMTSPDKSRNNGSYRHHVCSFEVNYQDIFDSSQKVLREYTNVLYSNFKTHSVCPLAFKTYKFKFGQINKMNATPDFYCYAICLHKGCRAFKFEIANINAIPMTCDAFQSKTELVHSPNAIKRRQIRGHERRKLGQIVIEKGATNTHLHMWDNANIEHLNFGNLSDAPNAATLATIRSEIVKADRLHNIGII